MKQPSVTIRIESEDETGVKFEIEFDPPIENSPKPDAKQPPSHVVGARVIGFLKEMVKRPS